MTELKDLKAGDEVTVTLTGKVIEKNEGDGYFQTYVNIDYSKDSDWLGINESDIRGGTVTIDRAPRPLPTELGVYVPAKNADFPQGSWIYKLKGPGYWSCMTARGILEASEALEEAKRAHENLGGLVRLVPEQ